MCNGSRGASAMRCGEAAGAPPRRRAGPKGGRLPEVEGEATDTWGRGSELKTEGRGCVAVGDGVTRSANARLVTALRVVL
jgi:hypothetical protein